MSEGKNRRVGRVVAVNRTDKQDRFGVGGIFTPFPGAYSLGFALKDDDDKYDDVVAIKTRSGKKVNVEDYYFNMYVNEELVPYESKED